MDEQYRVVVSKAIESEAPERVISAYHCQDLLLPGRADMYPHPVALEWHRGQRFVR